MGFFYMGCGCGEKCVCGWGEEKGEQGGVRDWRTSTVTVAALWACAVDDLAEAVLRVTARSGPG